MAGAHHLAVTCEPDGNGFRCKVTVGDDPGATHHEVRVSQGDLQRLAPGSTDPVALVTASFRFLLEREPRESILRTFDLPVIERYFPSYPNDILERLP
jgi:hypothetical protein